MKQFTGTVISTKQQKTVVVQVVRNWSHPVYKKTVKRTKNYSCDTGEMVVQVGDSVVIEEVRPISKTKHFKIKSKSE